MTMSATGAIEEPRAGGLLLKHLLTGVRNRALYPPEHPEVLAPAQALIDTVNELYQEQSEVTLALIDGEAYLNGQPLREASVQYEDFLGHMHEAGIEVLRFAREVTVEEAGAIIDLLMQKPETIQAAGGFPRLLGREGLSHITCEKLVAMHEATYDVFETNASSRDGSTATEEETDAEAHPLAPPIESQRSYTGFVDGVRDAFEGAATSRAVTGSALTSLAERIVAELLNDPGAFLGLLHIRAVGEDVFQHVVNVALLSVLLGSKLEMDEEQLRLLGTGALLHDVGELYVPKELRLKPGPLTEEEWAIVQEHPAQGAKLILGTGGLDPAVATVVLEHHVEFHGGGYPKLVGRQRPHLYSRIVAIADAYDAITHPRPYQPEALRVLATQQVLARAGEAFDPTLVKVLVHSIGYYPPGTPVRLTDGRVGIVESHNAGQPFLPRVLVETAQGFDRIDTASFGEDGEPEISPEAVLGGPEVPAPVAVRRLEAEA